MRRHKTQLRDMHEIVAQLLLRRSQEEEWAEERIRQSARGKTRYAHNRMRQSTCHDKSAKTDRPTAQVETLLKTQDPSDEGAKDSQISNTSSREKNNVRFDVIDLDAIGGGAAMDIGDLPIGANNPIPDTMGSVDTGNYPYPQELQSLGLEEALPTADAIADLYVSHMVQGRDLADVDYQYPNLLR